MPPIHNRLALLDRRRALRVRSTPAERRLWHALRRRQLDGLRFRRQHSILNYVVDVYCAEAGLVIEVDGAVHADPARNAYDARRQRDLEALGLRVLRVSNEDVLERLDLVVAAVRQATHREIDLPLSPS